MFSNTCAFEAMTGIGSPAHPAATVKRKFCFQHFAAEGRRERKALQPRLHLPAPHREGFREPDLLTAGRRSEGQYRGGLQDHRPGLYRPVGIELLATL